MIPRHRPEFGLGDLLRSLSMATPDLARELPPLFGRSKAYWVPSGRAGLAVALNAVGARAAIVPAFNCWAVMNSLEVAGTTPVFVDVGDDLNADAGQTLEAIRTAPKGTALLLTHQFGVPMAGTKELLDAARQVGMPVIEDAAAAVGARSDAGAAGAVGDLSVFSFQYTKSVFAGDGGLVLSSAPDRFDIETARRAFAWRGPFASARELMKLAAIVLLTHPRLYGWTAYRMIPPEGTANERGAPAPAELFRNLPSRWMRRLAGLTWQRLDATLTARRRVARTYLDGLSGVAVGVVPAVADEGSAPIRFPLLIERREEFIRRCAAAGLDLGRSFPYTCSDGGFPRAEAIARTIVNLPLTARLEHRVPDIIRIVHRSIESAP